MSANTHSHSYTELLLCLAGDDFYGMHGKAQSLSLGEVLLFPPGVRHDSGYSRHHGAGTDLRFHFLTPKHVGINIVEHRVGTRILSRRVAGFSPFHFHREFRRVEKNITREFIETERLKLACKLLERGRSVTSAAIDSGFPTCSHFNRTFEKKALVLPPSPGSRAERNKSIP